MSYKKTSLALSCLLFTLQVLFSCKPPKTAATEPVEKTAFFTIALTRDSVAKKTGVELKNINVVDQKIRYNIDEGQSQNPYFLKIEIEYKNGRVITAFTEHPLYKHLEIYSESGKIESKLIPLSQGEVTARVPYFEKYKKITVVEIVNFKEVKPITLKNEK
ncbi:MAG: hypothetical protein V4635_15410 [Bacteroidota bacterium]